MVLMDPRVSRYLERLEIQQAKPGLDGLNQLIRRHLEVFPFETLSIHSGERIELDIDWLLEKMLARGRGGFCYELGGALAWLLEQLGYPVKRLAAQVYNENGEIGIPFDHLTLEVLIDEPYLVDVGFGDSPRSALPLRTGGVLNDGTSDYRLASNADSYVLERYVDKWKKQYRFGRAAHTLADFTPGSAFHQSGDSPFAVGPICSLLRGDERVTLRKDKMIRTAASGSKQETPISDAAEFMTVLRREFGIELDRPITLPSVAES